MRHEPPQKPPGKLSTMSTRTLAPSEGGTTGFRRLKFANAIDPRRLRAILDGAGEDIPASGLSEDQITGLNALNDDLGRTIFLLQAPEQHPSEDICFILGLDKKEPRARIRAIVSRAFWIADSYAAAYARELDDAVRAREEAELLEHFFSMWAGNTDSVFDKGHRYRGGFNTDSRISNAVERWSRLYDRSADEVVEQENEIARGMAALDGLCKDLKRAADQRAPGVGPTEHNAQFFFLIRLAEVFTIWSGLAPSFSYDQGKKYRKRGKSWHTFVTAAFQITGLGKEGLGNLHRRLGGKGPGAIASYANEEYRFKIREVAKKLNFNFFGRAQEHENKIELIETLLDATQISSEPPEVNDLREALSAIGANIQQMTFHIGLDDFDRQIFLKWYDGHYPFSNNSIARGISCLRKTLEDMGLNELDLIELRKKAARPSSAEVELARQLGSPDREQQPLLAEWYYSKDRGRPFCSGDLPSSGWLIDYKLAPEPADYD
ncbi:hypothetical protein [Methylosinus sp. KRF6]|uniref:hypothetical protein n=1 Tax=Methylosinus sp. KRF6 TaxID=2846853 RepID=UPI001C0B60CA|nr:hypothetical protein [Methylosinus sp. KRF6]MBU3887205.1 hypothetical protein [Methylosinus sp. KRF6]